MLIYFYTETIPTKLLFRSNLNCIGDFQNSWVDVKLIQFNYLCVKNLGDIFHFFLLFVA